MIGGSATGRLVVISGGQSGTDRAALDAALGLGLAVSGWCPKGRWAEDGPIAPSYPLRETASSDPAERTEANVRDAEATLVLTLGSMDEGTQRTVAAAGRLGKPCLVIDLGVVDETPTACEWFARLKPASLNVAGPRESNALGLYGRAQLFLEDLFRNVAFDDDLDQHARR